MNRSRCLLSPPKRTFVFAQLSLSPALNRCERIFLSDSVLCDMLKYRHTSKASDTPSLAALVGPARTHHAAAKKQEARYTIHSGRHVIPRWFWCCCWSGKLIIQPSRISPKHASALEIKTSIFSLFRQRKHSE